MSALQRPESSRLNVEPTLMNFISVMPRASRAEASNRPPLTPSLRARCRRAGLAIWRGIEAYGHARALRELRSLRDDWQTTDPQPAGQLKAGAAFLLRR